jgi:PAS domain S-box-containing protein
MRHRRDNIKNEKTFDELAYFNHFFHCNNIDKNINEIISNETALEAENRLKELFPCIIEDTEKEFDAAVISMKKVTIRISMSEYMWFKYLINIAENIPVCITVSSAKKEQFGFPLLYVNKQFEKTTGYNRDDVIGNNCKFLQTRTPIPNEYVMHKRMETALRMGMSTSAIVTNVKKNTIPFHNLISLKPVIDEDGNYLYVLGIQSEITTKPINNVDIKNIIDILNILSKIKIHIITTEI